jgi:hypothetical protein
MNDDPNVFFKDKISQGFLAFSRILLPSFWGIDAKQTDSHLMVSDQDGDCITVRNSDHLARQGVGGGQIDQGKEEGGHLLRSLDSDCFSRYDFVRDPNKSV